jgi:membrane associated rhomboid family serine protease/Zn-finger nucleic acid-binding protein
VQEAAGGRFARQLWSAAAQHPESGKRPCPSCRRRMAEVRAEEDAPKLDVCQRCHFVWFDSREYEQVAGARIAARKRQQVPPAGKSDPPVPQPAEEEEPHEWWRVLAALFGLPLEREIDVVRHLPWATWGMALCMAAVTILAYLAPEGIVQECTFDSKNPWRYGGLTFITSFFLHAGPLHLLGNAYFLLVFGDNVEDFLGKIRYILLIAFAAVSGDLTHLWLDKSGLPLVGASGGISGIVVFYALQFPHAKLGLFLWVRWVWIPAWLALIFWIVMQTVIAGVQLHELTHISGLAHLGGAAAGFFAWSVWGRAWSRGRPDPVGASSLGG